MFKVAIVGRTNVGKSTLFNLLIGKKKSIISTEPGTTRDRIYGECFWRGETFELIDIGGLRKKEWADEEVEKEIQKQIEIALKEADLILFLLNIKEGIKKQDQQIAQKLKKLKKPIILALNKVDGPQLRESVEEQKFLKFGFGKPFLISALTGSGIGDLLDEIIKQLPECPANRATESAGNQAIRNKKENSQLLKYPGSQLTKIAIIGKTNIGKSTLVNSLLGQERLIVTALPHTTREPIDTFLEYKGKPLILIDTAGIRKRTKIKSEIEKIGLEKSLKMIKRAEIVFLMLDLSEKVSFLDKKLAGLLEKEKRGVILVINKFDLARLRLEKYLDYYQNALPNLWWAPIIFISAKEKINLEKLLDLTLEIKAKMKRLFEPEKLNKVLKEIIRESGFKEKYWSKAEIKQITTKIPFFIINLPKLTRKDIPPLAAQINLLKKKIRREFDLWGVPIIIKIKN